LGPCSPHLRSVRTWPSRCGLVLPLGSKAWVPSSHSSRERHRRGTIRMAQHQLFPSSRHLLP
jgi:hypothetical protein